MAKDLRQIREANQQERQEAEEIVTSLRDGEFSVVCSHLRSGLPLPKRAAEELADMLEGKSLFFRPVWKDQRPGQARWSQYAEKWDERMRIGVDAKLRIAALGPKYWAEAIHQTAKKFGCSEATVRKNQAFVERHLERNPSDRRGDVWGSWVETYSTP